jgi:hypothetical protein
MAPSAATSVFEHPDTALERGGAGECRRGGVGWLPNSRRVPTGLGFSNGPLAAPAPSARPKDKLLSDVTAVASGYLENGDSAEATADTVKPRG